jgi:hypothetical protein
MSCHASVVQERRLLQEMSLLRRKKQLLQQEAISKLNDAAALNGIVLDQAVQMKVDDQDKR